MKRLLLVAPLAAACTQPPAPPIPGAIVDATYGAPADLSQQAARPCGYTLAYDADGGVHQDAIGTITYDAGGRDVAEHVVDAHTGAALYDDATTFDAAGSWVTFTETRHDGSPDSTLYAAYDSFERLVRYWGTSSGSDFTATYGYGADDRRVSAHLVFPSVTYDRAYTYGADGRLAELDRDDGPDGHVDRISTYHYDDDARVASFDVADATGRNLGGGNTTYDDQDRLLSDESIDLQPDYSADSTEVRVYDGDREASVSWGTHFATPAGAPAGYFADTIVWRYDGCR